MPAQATTTIILIIVSVYVLGALTVPVLDALGIAQGCVLGEDGAPVASASPSSPTPRAPGLPPRQTSLSEAPPVAPLPLRTLQALDAYVYPLLTVRPSSPSRTAPPPPPRGEDLEMVDVGADSLDTVDPTSPMMMPAPAAGRGADVV